MVVAACALSACGGSDGPSAPPPHQDGGPPSRGGESVNLTIEGLHITQAVQTHDGDVPLIAGRPGLLRIFVTGSAPNDERPAVRVRLYHGTALAQTLTIEAPADSTPTSMSEGSLASTWNTVLDASLLRPGLRVLADVDPDNQVVEPSESDNAWPRTGAPLPLDVRVAPPLAVRFVPVLQSVNGLQGNVTPENRDAYLGLTRSMFPLEGVDADVRATFTTSAPPLEPNNGNAAWSQILNEIRALRAADGSARHYYGVVKTSYSSGVAGVAYLGYGAAVGWDSPSQGSRVMAHELGHTFGREHAPCGLNGADGNYPYPGGVIGVYGYDLATGELQAPSEADLMGYCHEVWISDYTYTGILQWREAHAAPFMRAGGEAALLATAPAQPGLLVWGRMHGDELILEPAFEVEAPPSLPTRPGPDVIEGLGASGEPLFAIPFTAEPVLDVPGSDDRTFAFVIPMSELKGVPLARLRLSSRGRTVERHSNAATLSLLTETSVVSSRTERRVRLTWDASRASGVLVRDGQSGDILAFGRDGRADVHGSADLELHFSDGVRTIKRRVGPGRPPSPSQ